MEARKVWIIARKELRDARRNRWVVLFAGGFAVLALGLSWLGSSSFFGHGLAGFRRTGASLVHLVLLLVPLLGVVLGGLAIAGERERGTLRVLLAHPITPAEVLLGKFVGLAAALLGALSLGFGASGIVIAWREGGTQLTAYLSLLGLACLLGLASLSLGFLVSTIARSTTAAVGMALFGWLGLVFLGDLGVLGSALILRLEVHELLALALVNPLQVFKVAAIFAIRGGGDLLGPAGNYASARYGAGLLPGLTLLLVAWTAAPLSGACLLFRRRGAS